MLLRVLAHGPNRVGPARGRRDAARRRQPLLRAAGDPVLVLLHRKPFVDLVHRHELLFAPPPRPMLHVFHVDFAVAAGAEGSHARVVTEAIFNTDNNPKKV
jgi:hypothetical protein